MNAPVSGILCISLPELISEEVFKQVLVQATEMGASDVLFRSAAAVRARMNNTLHVISDVAVSGEDIKMFVAKVESQKLLTSVIAGEPRSFVYQFRHRDATMRYRVSASAVNDAVGTDGIRLVFRPIESRPPALESLALPASLQAALTTPINKGMILVTGETGSGKTTLLAATLDAKARMAGQHIAALEDPVEFNLFYLNAETTSLVGQAAHGLHVGTFSDGLRGLLRDNPDVIMVGEMRDAETIRLAAEACRTGHLVYSTLHVQSVSAVVDRLSIQFNTDDRLAIAASVIDSLRCCVNQELLEKLCPHCSEPVKTVGALVSELQPDLSHARVRGAGCEHCHFEGVRGRTPLVEYLVLNNSDRSLLNRVLLNDGIGAVTRELQVMVAAQGQSKLQAAQRAFERGLITEHWLEQIYIEYRVREEAL